MNEFIWQDHHNIGHASIDSQHQNLFELANRISNVGNNNHEITRLVMLFYRHIREHFQAEEELMKQSAYPGYIRHVEAHNQMLDKLVEISNRVRLGEWSSTDIQHFVNHWVLVHIIEVDRILGEHLSKTNQLPAHLEE